jgi:DNA end-binding protein Ku
MHFADEVDPPADVVPGRLPSVSERELDMALDLISAFSGKWEPKKYKDTYTAELKKVVRAKVQGKEVHRVAEPEEEPATDLMEALRASVEQVQGRSRKGGRRTAAKKR